MYFLLFLSSSDLSLPYNLPRATVILSFSWPPTHCHTSHLGYSLTKKNFLSLLPLSDWLFIGLAFLSDWLFILIMEHYLTCPSRGTLLRPTGFFHIIIIVFPILSIVFGFCSLCTNDIDFCLMDFYTLFFFNHQLSFWKQFFSWWPTIVYCIVVLCLFLLLFVLYFSENKLYMKL